MLIHTVAPKDDLRSIVEPLDRGQSILIADDAMITGSTLVSIRRKIHRIVQERRDWITIGAFVALARPPDAVALRVMKNNFGERAEDGAGYATRLVAAETTAVFATDDRP